MQFVSDLHLHSKYSRAVSPQMTLPVMVQYARQKGIDILSASDFTHPLWFKEIQGLLEEAGEGLYEVRGEMGEVRSGKRILFLLATEISSIYKQGDKLRRIHNLVFMPNLEAAEKLNSELTRRGCNLNADGRPIIGLTSKNLLEVILAIDERAMLIPCHIWTPHFGIYGSASGFDSLEEAFGELAPYIYGIETGLSSDPDMNWQVQELMHRTILSFSDAHSPAKMLREATVFEMEEASYENIRQAIMRLSVLSSLPAGRQGQSSVSGQSVSQITGQSKTGKPNAENRKPKTDNRIAYTLEFYPEEGKYHFSGHRNCKVVLGPEEIKKNGVICPVCKRRLTEGVFMRVGQLADSKLASRVQEKKDTQGLNWYTDTLHIQPPFVKLVPLLEIVAESLSSTVMSQKSKDLYAKVCHELVSEINVLLHAPIEDIRKVGGATLAEALTKVRGGDISIDPGFDGEFGKVKIWESGEEPKKEKKATKIAEDQMKLDI